MNPSDPIGRPRQTGALFARIYPCVFHKKDSISLLEALLEFSSLKKSLIVYSIDDEYEFVRPRLECSPSKQQFARKCWGLKRLCRSNLSKGASAGGMTGDDAVIFELSEKLWGEEIMREAKEKERERSARAVNLEALNALLGLGDVSLLKEGLDRGGGDVRAKSEGKSSGMVSGKGGKRKREDEPGKISGMAENGSGEDGEIVGSDKSSAKSGSEDGESARKVPRKKEKKHKGVENGELAKAADSRAKSGLVDGISASYELTRKKKHKRVERSRELEDLSEKESGNGDNGSARPAADSQLDKGKSLRKKKKHKGDETGEFKRLSESGSADEELHSIGKSAKSAKSRVKSGSEDGKLPRSFSEKEKKHNGDKKSRKLGNLSEKGSGDEKSNAEDDGLGKSAKGSASLQLGDGKSSRKKKKHKAIDLKATDIK